MVLSIMMTCLKKCQNFFHHVSDKIKVWHTCFTKKDFSKLQYFYDYALVKI